jgi:hypothetical protein
MVPGIGPISGGQGGINADLGGGPSEALGGQADGAGGQIFNFAQPESVQLVERFNIPLLVGAALVGVWLYKRA